MVDSYDDAFLRLTQITSESGWFVYCFEEEQWHLYNEEGELIIAKPTIEELANHQVPIDWYYEEPGGYGKNTAKYGVRSEEQPTNVDFLTDYNYRSRTTHGTDEDKHYHRHGK